MSADTPVAAADSDAQKRPPGLLIGRVLGVPVLVAPSWFVLAAVLVVVYGSSVSEQVGPVTAYGVTAGFVLVLGLSVLLHEIGHCVMARAFGLPVRSITVTLLAGLTEITSPPQTPAREYAVAVVGPVVSLLLAGCGYAAASAVEPGTLPHLFLRGTAAMNGLVAVLNLLPGLPLDGGRVLRSAVWAISGDGDQATVVSAWAGRVLALLVVPAALLLVLPELLGYSPDLFSVVLTAFVSGFIYIGATASLRAGQMRQRVPGLSVAALLRPALGVAGDLPLAEAVRRAQLTGVRGLVVVDSDGRPLAVVSEAAVAAVPEQRRPWLAVSAVARTLEPGMVLDAGLTGQALLDAVRAAPAQTYVVQDPQGRLAIVSADDLGAALLAPRRKVAAP